MRFPKSESRRRKLCSVRACRCPYRMFPRAYQSLGLCLQIGENLWNINLFFPQLGYLKVQRLRIAPDAL